MNSRNFGGPVIPVEIVEELWCDPETGQDARHELVARTPIQVAVCRAAVADIFVLHTHHPPLSPAHRGTLAAGLGKRFGSAVGLAFVLQTATGWCSLDPAHLGSSVAARRDAAAATAVVQASWAWDESPKITIELGASKIVVEPRFDNARWVVNVGMETPV
jgi:hypothetical protein